MADMTVAYSPSHGLGEEQSIWFKLTPLLNQENPMQVLMALSDKYGGVIPINLKNQRIILLSEPAHAERVLVSNADNYTKYFDGLRPIFGRIMITIDGALGRIRRDRRDHRNGRRNLDARRRNGLQGFVRSRDAVQSAFHFQSGQD